MAKAAKPQMKHGAPMENNNASKNKDDKKENVTFVSEVKPRGNSAKYRISRLKRDFPDIAARIETGEFKTVSEAERAAGIAGREKLTPVQKIVNAIERLSDDEKAELLALGYQLPA
jgi:hypothetical protein